MAATRIIRIASRRIRNDTNVVQVYFDAYGNPVRIPPGEEADVTYKTVTVLPTGDGAAKASAKKASSKGRRKRG